MTHGIIIAADSSQEWLLSWWWENYQKYNQLPVCFFDLGMSEKAKNWCAQHGTLIVLENFSENGPIDPTLAAEWERKTGSWVWNARKAWFQKPIACQKSPFQKTVWMDLDCQILGNIEEIFDYTECPARFAVAHDAFAPHGIPYPTYQAGVLAFDHDSPILNEWSLLCRIISHKHFSDQELLSLVIYKKSLWMCPLPSIFNQSYREAVSKNTKIIHWHGENGKQMLQHQILSTDNKILF